MVEMIL